MTAPSWARLRLHADMPPEEAFAGSIDLLKVCYWYQCYQAILGCDMAARLPLLSVPVLVMRAPDDPLHEAHRRVVATIQNCQEFIGRAFCRAWCNQLPCLQRWGSASSATAAFVTIELRHSDHRSFASMRRSSDRQVGVGEFSHLRAALGCLLQRN